MNKASFHFKANRLITYICAFLIILSNGTVYTNMQGGIPHLASIVTYIPIVLLLILLFEKKAYSKGKVVKYFSAYFAICIYFLVFILFTKSNVRLAILQLITVFVVFIYVGLVETDNQPVIFIAYRDIIFVIAFISLFFWLFGSILHIIPYTNSIITTWGNSGVPIKSYGMVYFEYEQMKIFGRLITSNRAIFVERAFATFSFSVGWIYELFIEKDKSKVRLIVFFLAMISTFSTTGMIVVIITVMLKYIFYGENKKLVNFIRIIFIPLAIAMAYFLINSLLEVKFAYGHSAASRQNDFINGINAWKNSMIVGYGFANPDIHESFHTGYSNSLSMILTQGGLIIAIPYFYCFIKAFVKGIQRKNINVCLFIIVFLIEVLFTAVAFRNIVMYVLAFLCIYISNHPEEGNA